MVVGTGSVEIMMTTAATARAVAPPSSLGVSAILDGIGGMMRVRMQRRSPSLRVPLPAVLAAAAVCGVVAIAALASGGNVRQDGDCLQRVKVWSPSVQTHVTRVLDFCD
jgi:hypothetical protein